MNDGVKIFAIAAAGVLGVTALGFATNAINLASLSFWGPKYEEARRKIEQQSIRRQEGVSEGVGSLCLNMRLETDPGRKKAFATLISQQTSATDTPLSADAERCKNEAESALGL